MMQLLKPLGLLGLLGIVVLIIIYIIKPNYQQKFISSTYVWKLSLKYRKKKIPVSKLRNILLIICQILILTACAAILAKPVQVLKTQEDLQEVIVIIDSSASMRTKLEDETRFERAIANAATFTEEVLNKNGIVSVIMAEEKALFLAERANKETAKTLTEELNGYLENELGDLNCSYGSADIDGAIVLCEEVLIENPEAQIYLYTDTKYSYVPKQVNVVSVAEEEEWNAAILNAEAELVDNYYKFTVDVACYGRDQEIDIDIDISNVNAIDSSATGTNMQFTATVDCSGEDTKQVVFLPASMYEKMENVSDDVVYVEIDDSDRIFSYQMIYVSIAADDSFQQDNAFQIYNGQKEVLRVQYASTTPNPFVTSALYVLKEYYADTWDIQITEIKKGDSESVETEGYDFYFFEHDEMPEKMPTDGVVMLANPYKAPAGSGIRVDQVNVGLRGSVFLSEEQEHTLLQDVTAENITISQYQKIVYDPSYEVLMNCNAQPVVAVKNEADSKVVVMGFSLHYSNLALTQDFPLFMLNIWDYFFPSTVQKSAFEVNETISFKARGDELTVTREGSLEEEASFTSFPAKLEVNLPGTYVLQQETFTGKEITEYIYVRIPADESNIWKVEDALREPLKQTDDSGYFNDLLLYIAAAMVAILFIEWWLQSRDNM